MSSDNSMIMEPGRKIEAQLENPIDNVLVTVADKLSPIFKRLNFTPNGITMLSTITGIGALYSLHQKDTTQFTIYLIISYFFDVMDGYYARKYGMVTPEGDRFDHYKDILFLAIGAYIMYSQYDAANFPVLLVVLLALFFLSVIYLGCQEVIASKENKSDVLGFTKDSASILSTMDEDTCKQRMGMLRWFGSGSMILVIILSVLYMNGDFNGIPSLGLGSTSSVIPGSNNLAEMLQPSSSDNTLPNVDGFDDSIHIMNRMDTFEPRADIVDIRNFGGLHNGLNRADLDFINELRNFGSANIGTSTAGPYSSNMMVDRLIRD